MRPVWRPSISNQLLPAGSAWKSCSGKPGRPLDPGAWIIAVGSGDSTLADDLLALGFSNLTLLDVSPLALARTKQMKFLKTNLPEPVFVGFFPKVTQPGNDWLGNDNVKEICSVSECISPGPEGWVQHWKHNELGFYDSEEILQQVIASESSLFDIYAYHLFPFRYLGGKFEAIEILPGESRLTLDYEFLGYDIVTKSVADFFECSPLSCNAGAKEYPVNRYCLIQDKKTALETLEKICQAGTYEPGPYYLFEVHRKH